jgi:hypothetical protein
MTHLAEHDRRHRKAQLYTYIKELIESLGVREEQLLREIRKVSETHDPDRVLNLYQKSPLLATTRRDISEKWDHIGTSRIAQSVLDKSGSAYTDMRNRVFIDLAMASKAKNLDRQETPVSWPQSRELQNALRHRTNLYGKLDLPSLPDDQPIFTVIGNNKIKHIGLGLPHDHWEDDEDNQRFKDWLPQYRAFLADTQAQPQFFDKSTVGVYIFDDSPLGKLLETEKVAYHRLSVDMERFSSRTRQWYRQFIEKVEPKSDLPTSVDARV